MNTREFNDSRINRIARIFAKMKLEYGDDWPDEAIRRLNNPKENKKDIMETALNELLRPPRL